MTNRADLFNLAVSNHQIGKLAEAETLYQEIIQREPAHVGALNNLAAIFLVQQRFAEAIPLLRQAVSIQPDYALAHINLGNALKEQGQLGEAVQCFRRAALISPRLSEAHYNLGNALLEKGHFAEAIGSFRQALSINPNSPEAHYNLGNALAYHGQPDEAIVAYRQALSLRPNYSLAYINLGNVLKDQRDFAGAAEAYRAPLSLGTDLDHFQRMALWNLSCLRLLLGDYESAWPGYVQGCSQTGTNQNSLHLPSWQGKTVLVTSQQALGDTIQFARYLPRLLQKGARVVFGCHPALHSLMADLPGIVQVVPAQGPWPPCDLHVELLSLPGLFGTTLATIPTEIPYLKANAERIEHWRQETTFSGEPQATAVACGSPLNIGIVWQGSMTIKGDRRSCPLAHFQKLAKINGVRLLSLQVGPGTEQLATASFPVIDLGTRFNQDSLADLAAALMNLDLVITIDTAAAHLAGALGVPVWTLLSYASDWRWLLERDDSPWYPTMRLFRQKRWGDWAEVFERIATAIGSFSPGSKNGGG